MLLLSWLENLKVTCVLNLDESSKALVTVASISLVPLASLLVAKLDLLWLTLLDMEA